MASCSRLGDSKDFYDDADRAFWNELVRDKGTDILPISLSFDHDFDEYGTYDWNIYVKMNIPRNRTIVSEALSFIYSTI